MKKSILILILKGTKMKKIIISILSVLILSVICYAETRSLKWNAPTQSSVLSTEIDVNGNRYIVPANVTTLDLESKVECGQNVAKARFIDNCTMFSDWSDNLTFEPQKPEQPTGITITDN